MVTAPLSAGHAHLRLLQDGRENDKIAEVYRSIENPKQFADRPILLQRDPNNDILFRFAKIAHEQKDLETPQFCSLRCWNQNEDKRPA